jgi:hypothetical protein
VKPKKLIHYRLGVSRYFPATHPKKGKSTYFKEKIQTAVFNDYAPCAGCDGADSCSVCEVSEILKEIWPKLHTIRANYDLWVKRFEKINKDEAVIDLFYWSGSPYRSKQVVFATLTKDDGIGIQKLEFDPKGILNPFVEDVYIDEVSFIDKTELAKNDGLSLEDWKAWFKGYDLSKPLAIIHFTSFRY